MVGWLLSQLEAGRKIIRDAPLPFFGLVAVGVVLCGFIIYQAEKWRYGGIIENLRAAHEAKTEGLNLELQRLRDQAASAKSRGLSSELSNAELRDQALSLVRMLRGFVEQSVLELQRQYPQSISATSSLISTEAYFPLSRQLEYERLFKVRAKTLKQLMEYRLPISAHEETVTSHYSSATLSSIRAVADDLERLARLLPN